MSYLQQPNTMCSAGNGCQGETEYPTERARSRKTLLSKKNVLYRYYVCIPVFINKRVLKCPIKWPICSENSRVIFFNNYWVVQQAKTQNYNTVFLCHENTFICFHISMYNKLKNPPNQSVEKAHIRKGLQNSIRYQFINLFENEMA